MKTRAEVAEILESDSASVASLERLLIRGAAHHRGTSKQDYATPWPFVRAVEERFGKIARDLAATSANARAMDFISPAENSLSHRWHLLTRSGRLLWLNPPFGQIAPWARKCALEQHHAAEAQLPFRLALLVPASVGTEWFAAHVFGQALVLFLRPRLSFDGKNPYPKDLMLAVYGEAPGVECWRWK